MSFPGFNINANGRFIKADGRFIMFIKADGRFIMQMCRRMEPPNGR